ncbi:MAG: lysine-2,3-aminomutase-like protein [Hyphomicrobiales bacterium]|nr:lysine-2,3-aminomutase-like protein [Hyphomicrobiales bacterium]
MKILRTLDDLARAGLIDGQERARLAPVAQHYAIGVTATMAGLMVPGAADDPLARQFLPDSRELVQVPQELQDPIGDDAHSPVKGVVHRHADRVLLKMLLTCPVYCRFCFRRESVGQAAGALNAAELDAALGYIAGHPEIWEVILTGGDPLMLSARRLADVLTRLAAMAHVKVVRLHSRVPVVAPGLITPAMVTALRRKDVAVYIAIHANHPRELGAEAQRAVAALADAGVPLVSQSVLLRGVNDDVDVLAALMRRFVELRIKPYYLHHPDLAPGTGHFRLPVAEGQSLMAALRRRISGLAMPVYVLDIPGGYGKVVLTPGAVTESAEDLMVRDASGRQHPYSS